MDILKLKKQISSRSSCYYFAIRAKLNLTEQQQQELITKQVTNYFEQNKIKVTPVSTTIEYYGDLRKFHFYKPMVGKFKKKAFEGKPIYRNYCVSEEQQKKSSMYCNVAEDSATSWNTVMSALNSKEGIIIKLIYDTSI